MNRLGRIKAVPCINTQYYWKLIFLKTLEQIKNY